MTSQGIRKLPCASLVSLSTQLCGLRPVVLLVHRGDSVLLASRCRRDNLGPVLFFVTIFRVLGHSDPRLVPKLVSSKRNDTSELDFDQNSAFKAGEGPASLNAPGHLAQGRGGMKALTELHRLLRAADVNTKVPTSTWLAPEACCMRLLHI